MVEASRQLAKPNYRKQIKMLSLAVAILLLLVACSKPLYDAIRQSHDQRWERALVEEAKKLHSGVNSFDAHSKEARDFGKELDVLTSFYETIISVLLAVLAVVAGLAFWTIKVVTRAQAEETATDAATRILGDHDGFRERLNAVVESAVELRMEEVNAKLEEYSVPFDLAVQNPERPVKTAGKPTSAKNPSKKTSKKSSNSIK